MTAPQTPEFSRIVDVEKLPRQPKHLKFNATADECAALAARFGLPGMVKFNVEAVVSAAGSGAWARAEVKLDAIYSRECVVSLREFESSKTLTFVRMFRKGLDVKPDDTGFVVSDDTDDDDADPLDEGRFDLGEAIAEEFGLDLDEFPKAPGVKYDGDGVDSPPSFGEDDAVQAPKSASPFAALEKIRDKLTKE